MSLFRSLSNVVSGVSDFMQKATFGAGPYEVQEISLQKVLRTELIAQEDSLALYKDGGIYQAVLHRPVSSPKVFSLYRVQNDVEAMTIFSNLSVKLPPLYLSTARILDTTQLQLLVETLRANPTWSSAHLAAKLGLVEAFRHNLISQHLNTSEEKRRLTPIHVALLTGNLELIQELIIGGVDVTLADIDGHNVFHYAARVDNPTLIQFLASKDPSAINQLNVFGESALHTACLENKPNNVEQLLRWGANAENSMSGRYPVHCAMKVSSSSCVETLCRWSRDQLLMQDKKYGGSPLHWAKTRESVYALADLGCNLDSRNNVGETPLHIMVQKDRLDCVMGLLVKAANASAVGQAGDNALHMAARTDNVAMVQTLIVFGADINAVNDLKQTPRHVTATGTGASRNLILFLLQRVGAQRCMPGTSGCNDGCASSGNFEGSPTEKVPSTPVHQKKYFDDMVTDVAMTAAMTRSASASSSAIMMGATVESNLSSPGDRVLCLDGGGIRGLMLIQLLLAIERAARQPIRNCFDWIGGTSTGGILALAIVHGKSIRYCQGLYFRLKDEVFTGKRPYDSEPLERLMKREFGENTRMNDREYPRVLVTGVLGDRHPAELHFFKNYELPGTDISPKPKDNESPFKPTHSPSEQYVWRAARGSGAAPTYFRAFGRFLDGGLIANNPTLDVLTEIHEYNMRLKSIGQGELAKPIHVVVSLGTGRIPSRPVNACDVYRPGGLLDVARVAMGAKNLSQLLIDQATQSEGRPVERAQAWCSMIGVPYFRLSANLSDDMPLDCTEDKTLVNMLWETQVYVHDNWEKIQSLATLLTH